MAAHDVLDHEPHFLKRIRLGMDGVAQGSGFVATSVDPWTAKMISLSGMTGRLSPDWMAYAHAALRTVSRWAAWASAGMPVT